MTRRMISLVAVVGLLASFAVAGTTSAAGPDLGPNVLVFDPSMPTSQIQAAVDSVATQQVSNQFGTQRYALLFKPGTYGSTTDPLNFQVGYYTAVAGLGQSPGDVVINGSVYVRNQCDGGRLHRAQQLLAVALEPHDQRDHAGLRLLQRRVLGRVAGGADAPGPRQRAHHPDGLLHRPVVRERRLHRRLGVRQQHRDQRLTAAVAGQEQLARRLDATASGTRCSRVSSARRPVLPRRPERLRPVHHARDEPGHARGALPVRGRRRRLQGLRAGRAARLRRHDLGERTDVRLVDPDR